VRRRHQTIQLKGDAQFALMRQAGLVVARTLETLREAVRPGVTTGELDAIAEESIAKEGATPSFKGYMGYPATICASVNDEIVHGIPGGRTLREGDLISIDCGAIVEGWHGDAAVTVPVGEVAPEALELTRVTEEAMWRGIAVFRVGGRLRDIGTAVESYATSQGEYGIVRGYGGHGIGTEMHMDPMVFNYRAADSGVTLRTGMALAIEPMLTLGRHETYEMPDGWTVRTSDGSLAAHVEHTVALTSDGLWVTTALDGGRAKLGELGIQAAAR
jgi:methionyl aminopeptidase